MRKEAEGDLVGKAKRGDSAAFGELIRRYQYPVYALALRILGDAAAAQDAAQETFIAAHAKLADLRSEKAFPSWLRAIARNAALARRKEIARMGPLEEAGTLAAEDASGEPDAAVERAELDAFRAEIGRVLASLSERLRFPLLLCYVDGVSTAEAARFLGIKAGTLRKRLHDGKRKLQQRVVGMAEKTLQEYRLPRDFAKRCICGCRRAQAARPEKKTERG